MQAPKDPSIRRAFASLILRIRDVEEKAIEAVERLIARCSALSPAVETELKSGDEVKK